MKNEYPSLTARGGAAPVLKSVSAHGTLEGLLLSMTLRQCFRNDTGKNMEVLYTFPLAWGAVLLGLQATLGGKRMKAQVMARQQARQQYEDAVENGDAPVMVEKASGNLFSASLGSLKPGEEANIELHYAQLLAFDQGRIRLVVPTTIAPRYGDALSKGQLAALQATTPSLATEHRFSFSLVLHGAVAQACIGSPTHMITQQRSADGVTVKLQRCAWLDRDFVLLLECLDGRSFAIASPDVLGGQGHAALVASYCPVLPRQEPSALRLKILVDCSGSMAGDSIQQARQALRPLAARLTQEDQVSFSRFGSQTQRVLGVVDGTTANIQLLLKAIDTTEADLGGTELATALQDTFSLRMGAARHADEADVLLITDGEVWDAQRIVDDARRSGHRVYALGVGSAPAESLLREMAEATRGACEFATPGQNMANAVQRLLLRIRTTVPVQATLESSNAPLWSSPMPRRMPDGETVHLFMRLSAMPEHAPVLDIVGMSAVQAELTIRDDDLIARLVAHREISLTADRHAAALRAERYQLVTDETNLLLVIERFEQEKTDGMPDLHQVQPMLAAGWAGTGTVVDRTPQPSWSLQRTGSASQQFSVSQGGFEPGVHHFPTVWRTNKNHLQAKVDALASSAMDDVEIPAFLRKNGYADETDIVAVFNEAAAQGHAFRQALRAVTDLFIEDRISALIGRVANQIGGPLKAWACYLLWLHDAHQPGQQLTPEARALALDQVSAISADARAEANLLFHREATTR